MREETLEKIKSTTARDRTMHRLMNVIYEGWPDEKKEVSAAITPYFDHRDELTTQDGLIYKGQQVDILMGMREQVKKRLHSSHLGMESCLCRARECVRLVKHTGADNTSRP